MDRRAFLRIAASAAAVPWVGTGCAAPRSVWLDADVADEATYPLGVLAGSPSENGIILLATVGDRVGLPSIGLEVAADPEFRRIIERSILTGPISSHGVPWRASLSGLEARSIYYYRFATRESFSPVGRFSTLPSVNDESPVRVAFFSCQAWQAGYFNAHRAMAAEPDIALAICLGDYIYELSRDQGPREDPTGDDGFAQTAIDYLDKYQLYRSDADLQAMHAAHSFFAIWDNHELAEDSPGHLRGRQPIFPADMRARFGRDAFWDFMPMERGPDEGPLRRSVRVGSVLEIFLLDTWEDPAPFGTGGSYLGAAQLTWLLDGLRTSTARWKVIASASVMLGLEQSPGMPVNLNQWDGYPEERRQIVQHVHDHNIEGVVVITGDLHTFLAGSVTTTGQLDGEPGIVEFSGGSISSLGLLALTPAHASVARTIEERAIEQNPHLEFMDIIARGYGVLDVSAEELVVTFRSPETALIPGAATRDLARFRLRHGSLEIERLPV